MRWSDAIARVRKPDITNRDAAGLLLFVRAAQRRYAPKYGLAPFDWLGFALPAFGWNEPGDRLVVSNAQQRAPYVASDALWSAVDELADELDELGQPFELVTMPQGTAGKFRELAELARRELLAQGNRMGAAISAADARKLVDGARSTAIANAKQAGKAFVVVQAFADGGVQTDQFDSRDEAQPMVDQFTGDDQVLAAGLWDANTGKLVTQKAGALEVTPDKTPSVETAAKKKPSTGSGWLLLLALVALSSRKRRGGW